MASPRSEFAAHIRSLPAASSFHSEATVTAPSFRVTLPLLQVISEPLLPGRERHGIRQQLRSLSPRLARGNSGHRVRGPTRSPYARRFAGSPLGGKYFSQHPSAPNLAAPPPAIASIAGSPALACSTRVACASLRGSAVNNPP